MNVLKQFGAKPSLHNLQQYARSRQWNGQIFENQEPTKVEVNFFSIPKLLYKQFCEKHREPAQQLPVLPFDNSQLQQSNNNFKAVWFGHSAIYIKIHNLNILIDPMFGPDAAPVAPLTVKRFSENTLALIDTLPQLDLVLISHDHYDHLDFESVQRLKNKTGQFYTALGVARHLEKWGVEKISIKEFDWWEQQEFQGIKITFTPSRHFSGRGLNDRAKSLWGGWAIKTNGENIWFSGDGGYGKHFAQIGERLGPFDFAFIECGQYNELWHQIHLYPEESVQAVLDARAKKAMPIHWAAFALAQHRWTEPVERFIAAAEKSGVHYILPRLGEMIRTGSEMRTQWWQTT